MSWQPTASLETLKQRAALIGLVRDFFAAREVLEVDVPLWSPTTATDLHLASVAVNCAEREGYLQTSPEFFLKRLLAAYPNQSLYYLGKAFRDGEASARHNPEFTMLEWYRPGWDEHRLMNEVEALLVQVLPGGKAERLSYAKLFEERFALNPHSASLEQLQQLAGSLFEVQWPDSDRNTWLDVLFSHGIEPQLQELTFVYDFPASQASLARTANNEQGETVARRFEVFFKGMELANGYWELTDSFEQKKRFQRDIEARQDQNLPQPPLDEQLLAALKNGFPDSAGVALGVDRLVMLALGLGSIEEVLAFPFARL